MASKPFSLPQLLEKAAAERRLTPFVGAGFSRNVSASFPDWNGVIDIAADLLGFDSKLLRLHGDHLQVAQFVRLERKFDELLNRLVMVFDDTSKFNVTASPPHLLLPYLRCPSIYTTNWDSWIERGFENQAIPYVRIRDADDLVRASVVKPAGPAVAPVRKPATGRARDPTRIVKFHGDFTQRQTLILAEEDYFRRIEFEDPLDLTLRAEIVGRSVLFLGYSFTDFNLRLMWYRLRQSLKSLDDPPTSFLVTAQRNPVAERLLTDIGITIVHLDRARIKDSLGEFLGALLDAQDAGA